MLGNSVLPVDINLLSKANKCYSTFRHVHYCAKVLGTFKYVLSQDNYFGVGNKYEKNINLLTESTVVTGKCPNGVLTVRIEPGGRGPYTKERSPIFSSNDQVDEVNNRFVTWLVLNKQTTLIKIRYMHIS